MFRHRSCIKIGMNRAFTPRACVYRTRRRGGTAGPVHREKSMDRQALRLKLMLSFGGMLLISAVAQAQPPGETLRQGPYTARGSLSYGPVTYYGALPAYSGYPLRRADESDVGFVSYYTSAYSPVFFTSINYPGVYGSHTIG